MSASPSAAAEPAHTGQGPGPDEILHMATGYWVSKALFTSLDLGVFEALSEAPRTSRRLAEQLDLPYDGTERLLTALAALGLVRREGELLMNTPSAEAF